MSNNAQWRVVLIVSMKDGQTWTEHVYLSSPDLRNIREAKRRATKTAKERTEKKFRKYYPNMFKELRAITCECVG